MTGALTARKVVRAAQELGLSTFNIVRFSDRAISRKIRSKLGDTISAYDLGIKGSRLWGSSATLGAPADDTQAGNNIFAEISASLAGEGHTLKTRLVFPSGDRFKTNGWTLNSDIHYDFCGGEILKGSGGGTYLTDALFRAIPTLSPSPLREVLPLSGSGYTSPPTVVITDGGPGTGAAAYAVLQGDKVAYIVMTAVGSGYTSPTISFTGGGGSGAAAIATLVSGRVMAINPTTGTGWTTATATVSGAGGSGATLTPIISGGAITGFTVTNGGANYTGPPTITITGDGINAAAYGRAGTYVGANQNITVEDFFLDPNGFVTPGHIFQALFVDDLKIRKGVVQHRSSNPNYGFALGGLRMDIDTVWVKDGDQLLQDALHIFHGGGEIRNVRLEGGDDALAFAGIADSNFLYDVQPITEWDVSGARCYSKKAAALRVFAAPGTFGNAQRAVTGITVRGLSGWGGQTRGAAILIDDQNDTSPSSAGVATSQINRVQVSGMNLQFGGPSHDGTNPWGISVRTARNVVIKGNIEPATGAISTARTADLFRCEDVSLRIRNTAIPIAGGPKFTSTYNCELREAIIRGTTTQAGPLFSLAGGALGTKIIASQLNNCRSGSNCIDATSTGNTLTISDTEIGHITGASGGLGISAASTTLDSLAISSSDFTKAKSPLGRTPTAAIPHLRIAGNDGLVSESRGVATITAGQTSVTISLSNLNIDLLDVSQIDVGLAQDNYSTVTSAKVALTNAGGASVPSFTITIGATQSLDIRFPWSVSAGVKPLV